MTAEETVDAQARTTAPQSPYTKRHVGIGVLVFLVGAAIVFGVPLAISI